MYKNLSQIRNKQIQHPTKDNSNKHGRSFDFFHEKLNQKLGFSQ